jgi:hypothetical protein
VTADIPSQAEDFFGPVVGPVGDETVGIRVRPRRCPAPCSGTIPTQPAMLASRHLQLTRVTEAAYFEAYLRGDDSVRCFLRRTLSREPDVKVKSAGTGQLVQ